jgi:hypothetical protein
MMQKPWFGQSSIGGADKGCTFLQTPRIVLHVFSALIDLDLDETYMKA